MTPPPGYLTRVWSRGAPAAPSPPPRASPPSSPLSPGAPHPPPCTRLANRQRPAGAGSRARVRALAELPSGRGHRALPSRSTPAAAARTECAGRPAPGRSPRAPPRRAGGRGLSAGIPQHGFGFGRAERGRAGDRHRY